MATAEVTVDALLDWIKAGGYTQTDAAKHFKMSRATFYRRIHSDDFLLEIWDDYHGQPEEWGFVRDELQAGKWPAGSERGYLGYFRAVEMITTTDHVSSLRA